MKWQDTIMNFTEQSKEMDRVQEAEELLSGCLIRKQAEIAFQAGVKEVVDWIERYSESDGDNPLEFSIFPEKYWQVQRKEWEKEC